MQTLRNFELRQKRVSGLRFKAIGLALSVTLAASAYGAPAASKPSVSSRAAPSNTVSDAVAHQIQKALSDSTSQLGQLEPWQEKIFREEVLPQSQRFIRDYRRSRTGIDVDVDLETLRSYLRFHATQSLKKDSSVIVVGLAPGADCDACSARLPQVRQLVKDRLERRGFTVVFAKSADSQQMTKLADEKQADGTFTASWARAAADEVDAAHADEVRYAIKCQLALREFPKQEGQLEIFETGSFEKSVGQLMTDFMTEIGSQVSRVARQSGDDNRAAGVQVEFRGIKRYAVYVRLKEKLLALGETAGIAFDERKVSAGKAVFSARTAMTSGQGASAKDVETVRKALGGLVIDIRPKGAPVAAASGTPASKTPNAAPADSGAEESSERYRLHLLNSGDRSLEWEIR